MNYRLSNFADQDLESIYIYSFQKFGETRADRYLLDLHEEFLNITINPSLGRTLSRIGFRQYRRHEHISHIIIYGTQDDIIIVQRVLHASMDIYAHLGIG